MTWLKSDSGHKPSSDPLKRGPRMPMQGEAAPEPPSLEDHENLPSVFEAMMVGEGQGIWGEERTSFPMDMQKELARDHGWIPERNWDIIRRMMTRDTEAV